MEEGLFPRGILSREGEYCPEGIAWGDIVQGGGCCPEGILAAGGGGYCSVTIFTVSLCSIKEMEKAVTFSG